MDEVKKGGVTNPYALAAIAATGQAESEFSPQNVNRRWSDPSESGKGGTSGALMSWRNERLGNLEKYAAMAGEDAGGISPRTQAKFFLQEDPLLIEALNRTESVDDAMRFMNRAWKFAGYDQPSKEVARRMGFANSFLPQFQGGGDATAGGSANGDSPAYLSYANQNATRNRPLSNELASALGFLPEMGITAEVFSGGQPGKDEGGARTGSTRHDHGNAADVFFSKDGRRLDWANPEDLPIFEEIVRRGKAAGITGFGAGEGYMQPGSMHIGFGDPAVWGAGGSGENAPEWLVNAYNSPAGNAVAEGGPQTSLDAVNAMATGGQPDQRNMLLANALVSGEQGNQGGMPRQQQLAQALMEGHGGEAGLPPEFQRSAQLQTAMQRPQGSIIQALMGGEAADPGQLAQARAAGMSGQGMDNGTPAGGDKRQLIENLMRNPATQEIGQRLLLQEMEQRALANDPMRALEMQKMRQDMQRGQPMMNLGDGRLFDPNTREFLTAPGTGTKTTPQIQNYEYYAERERQAGRQPLGPLEWNLAQKKAGANTTNVSVGESGADAELRKKLSGKEGEAWAALKEAGTVSAGTVQDMQLLDELIKQAPQGPLQGRLAQAFPGFSTAGSAFESIVKRVAPTLRAPGSGATSDIEYDGMLRSLPALSNYPEANAAISEMMKAKAQINMERSAVIDRYQNEEISAAQARRELAALNSRSIMSPQIEGAFKTLGIDVRGGEAKADPLAQAREAISKGADRNAVIQRLKENGIDAGGL
ncbi:hypothetical protein P9A16_31670 [Shinella sp. 838]|uniref:hypothetical protein n=1 Tax=Shinella sp. 838 TaxID=3038164 RepID=UPI002415126B|nr:hypothetical protein [Shinella sp. 838]MDG4675661.1 hypothetical protein [Shinella sp. 838]